MDSVALHPDLLTWFLLAIVILAIGGGAWLARR